MVVDCETKVDWGLRQGHVESTGEMEEDCWGPQERISDRKHRSLAQTYIGVRMGPAFSGKCGSHYDQRKCSLDTE